MTKLNKLEREDRKFLRANFPGVFLYSFPDAGATVGVERTGEVMGVFAVAIAADDEAKFRRKVGEFEVLKRFAEGRVLPAYIGEKDGDDVADALYDAAVQIADAVTVGRPYFMGKAE